MRGVRYAYRAPLFYTLGRLPIRIRSVIFLLIRIRIRRAEKTSWNTGTRPVEIGRDPCNTKSMKEIKETSYYIRRSYTDFVGRVVKVDHVGPYMENQEFAVGLQRQHDMRRQRPDVIQITKWEWIDGVTAIADLVFD